MSVWALLQKNRSFANELEGIVAAVERRKTEAALRSLSNPPPPWFKVDVSRFLAATRDLFHFGFDIVNQYRAIDLDIVGKCLKQVFHPLIEKNFQMRAISDHLFEDLQRKVDECKIHWLGVVRIGVCPALAEAIEEMWSSVEAFHTVTYVFIGNLYTLSLSLRDASGFDIVLTNTCLAASAPEDKMAYITYFHAHYGRIQTSTGVLMIRDQIKWLGDQVGSCYRKICKQLAGVTCCLKKVWALHQIQMQGLHPTLKFSSDDLSEAEFDRCGKTSSLSFTEPLRTARSYLQKLRNFVCRELVDLPLVTWSTLQPEFICMEEQLAFQRVLDAIGWLLDQACVNLERYRESEYALGVLECHVEYVDRYALPQTEVVPM